MVRTNSDCLTLHYETSFKDRLDQFPASVEVGSEHVENALPCHVKRHPRREKVLVGESEAIIRVETLAEVYWESTSDFLAHGPKWDQEYWSRVLKHPDLENFSWNTEWGTCITRGLILRLWDLADDEVSAREAFFLTMAWGFGSSPRGRWKTLAMFNSMESKCFGTYLLSVKELAKSSSSVAYSSLLSHRIKQLGPVYASKLLYAMSPADKRSPVMDMWIERWGKNPFELKFSVHSSQSIQRNVDALENFTRFCEAALGELQSRKPSSRPESESDIGFVEYLIFWDAKYQGKRKWQGTAAFPKWVQATTL